MMKILLHVSYGEDVPSYISINKEAYALTDDCEVLGGKKWQQGFNILWHMTWFQRELE